MHATLITDIQGPSLTSLEREWLTNPYLGGLILFTRHFESFTQLQDLVAEISTINPKLIITVDHEGGRVQRFRDGFTLVPAMGKLAPLYQQDKSSGLAAAKACATVLASELLNIGIHLTYAPVLDVNYSRNTVIADRAFSDNTSDIVQLAESFMLGLKEMGFAVVAKHFPGHGWVNLDSHVACPVDDRPLEQLEAQDMKTFEALLSNIDWMMPAHVVYEKVDSEPAGFSKVWLQDILRKKMKFTGRIVSDDLSMAGAAVKGNYAQRAQAALNAGCDILLTCNSSEASLEILAAMEEQGVEPMDLENYKPKANEAILQSGAYIQAKALLESLSL